jgi:hypothetical protein
MARMKLLLFWTFLVCVTLGLTESIVRLALTPPGLLRRGDDAMLMKPQAPMGYALAPGAAWHYTAGGHEAAIRINERGFRDGPFESALKANIRILGVGDSFTLGLGVDSTDPWPQQLEGLLRTQFGSSLRVVNAGVPGYSTRQMREMLQQVVPELHPQVVVLAVVGEKYWRVDAPYVLLDGYLLKSDVIPELRPGPKGTYYFSPIMRWPWLHRLDLWMNQYFQLGAHLLSASSRLYAWVVRPPPWHEDKPIDLAEAERRLTPTVREIQRADSVARGGGMALVVLLVNTQEVDGSFNPDQYSYNQVLRDFCSDHGIRVVDPLPVLAGTAAGRPIYRSPDDGHWTRAAHRVVAEVLDRYLVGSGLLSESRARPRAYLPAAIDAAASGPSEANAPHGAR